MTLKETSRTTIAGERIIKIASSFMYVEAGTPVYAILAEMHEPYQNAIAVVDADRKVQGVIIPQDLVEMLGKPFGRDLLQRQRAEDIMHPAVTFPYDEYIQEVQERIHGDLEKDTNTHYVLTDDHNIFYGHFSAQDILLHAMNEQQRELNTAATIQGRLVPSWIAVHGKKVSVTCTAVMAQNVGGDYYYVKEYSPGQWFFCLCDISGKGISAAIITAVLSGFMYNADFSIPLEGLVGRLNRIIIDTFKLEKYLTGFFARFSETTGELEYCDMGHSFFYTVEDKSIQQIADTADNTPLGLMLMDNQEITTRLLRIAPGTVFVLISDGIVEQGNRKNELFPIDTLGELIGTSICNDEDLIHAKIRILETFYAFKKDMPQHDDISLLLFHYHR